MATIVAVHGTFATGPEEGEGWWQTGGALERDVRELVEADDSRLDFAPHVWDGQNSETSRRAAGQALLQRLVALEQKGEKYCLIGHSHGGSVIASALFSAGSRRNALPGLSRWLTVGTPFIRGRKRGFLFSRLGLWTKSAYISFLAPACYVAAAAAWSIIGQAAPLNLAATSIVIAFIALWIFLPFMLLHALLWWQDRGRLRLFRPKDHARARQTFHGRWLAFRHRGDEAVEGLRAVHKIELPIFSRRFLVAPLVAVTVLLAPVLAILAWEAIPLPELSFPDGFEAGRKLAETTEVKGIPAWLIMVAVLGTPLAVALAVFLPATGFVLAMQALSTRLSAVLSRLFDRITWHQIRQSAFGNDTVGEVAMTAAERPAWAAISPAPLPDELGEEVSAFADAAAAQSVSKLRRAVQLLAFSEGEQGKSDLLAEYLTWDELIHTAYFKVARFRKLVAFAIAHSPGFRPSDKFRSDPDFATVARWYAQLSA